MSRKDAETQMDFLASFATWREHSSFQITEIYASVYKGLFAGPPASCRPTAQRSPRLPTFRKGDRIQVSRLIEKLHFAPEPARYRRSRTPLRNDRQGACGESLRSRTSLCKQFPRKSTCAPRPGRRWFLRCSTLPAPPPAPDARPDPYRRWSPPRGSCHRRSAAYR